MRKAMLLSVMVSVVLVVAGVSFAAPTGPGGTIYFVQNNDTTVGLGYLDISSAWTPIGSPTALSSTTLQQSQPAGFPAELGADAGAWFNPATGLQNETTLHSGYIAMTGRYNNQQDAASSNANAGGTGDDEFDKGYDIVAWDSTAGTPNITVLNSGFDQFGSQPNTTIGNAYSRVVVDSGFTPNGEAQGYYFVNNGGNADVWTNNGSGDYNIATPTGYDRHALTGTTYPNQPGKYTRLSGAGATVNFGSGPVAVTGVVVTENGSIFDGNNFWAYTYKKAAGGYQTVYSSAQPADMCGVFNIGSFLVGDTNNDGKIDVYYLGYNNNSNEFDFIHASDKVGDGTIQDLGDFDSAHLVGTYGDNLKFGATALIDTGTKFANGSDQYAILYWLSYGSGTYADMVGISFLDSNGDFTEGEWGATQVITNAASLDGYQNIVWVPLATPEPCSMLLLGTGALGLLGYVRRRFSM